MVEILGTKFECVDEGFGRNRPVDVVIRPEDVVLGEEGQGILDGVVTSLIFKAYITRWKWRQMDMSGLFTAQTVIQ